MCLEFSIFFFYIFFFFFFFSEFWVVVGDMVVRFPEVILINCVRIWWFVEKNVV